MTRLRLNNWMRFRNAAVSYSWKYFFLIPDCLDPNDLNGLQVLILFFFLIVVQFK